MSLTFFGKVDSLMLTVSPEGCEALRFGAKTMPIGSTNNDDGSQSSSSGRSSGGDEGRPRKFVAVHGLENTDMFYEGVECVETGNKAQGVVMEKHYSRKKGQEYWEGEPVKRAVWLGMKRVLSDDELENYKFKEFTG